MKKILSILLTFVALNIFAQAPQAIKYQAIVRNNTGNILINQSISMKISIMADSAMGNSVYSETFFVTTNAYGLVNLEIGKGTIESGNFSEIDWGRGTYFVRIEADENAGSNFSLLGISQLLSVPYSMYANESGMPSLTDDQRNGLINPRSGMLIFNSTTNSINARINGNWLQLSGLCVPQPTNPDAGPDIISCTDTSVQLSANAPVSGIGTWQIISGQGGSFSDNHDPNAMFHGLNNTTYMLQWQISTSCQTLTDNLQVIINKMNTPNAGIDQHIYNSSATTLNGSPLGLQTTGAWSIISGIGGQVISGNSPNSSFQGNIGVNYTLRWTTTNFCETKFDDVVISFCPNITIASAGPDIQLSSGTICNLNGNQPNNSNIGLWTIISGNGGSFFAPNLYNTIFYGLPSTTYVLRWTITTICDTSYDEVTVTTGSTSTCGQPFIYGGQTYNTVYIGTQCWMKENLNIGTMINGGSNQTNNGIIEKYCYDNISSNCDIYGGLYQWNEIMQYNTTPGSQGICPPDFHIPTNNEWMILTNFLGGEQYAGNNLKEAGNDHWISGNTANNNSNFTALGAGPRYLGGYFQYQQMYTYFWSSNNNGTINADSYYLKFDLTSFLLHTDNRNYGFSVRCIKN